MPNSLKLLILTWMLIGFALFGGLGFYFGQKLAKKECRPQQEQMPPAEQQLPDEEQPVEHPTPPSPSDLERPPLPTNGGMFPEPLRSPPGQIKKQ